MSFKILCPHCRKPLGREGVEKDAVCPHCGKPTALPEPAPASSSDQPHLEARVWAAPKGLSVASFLLGLGVLLVPLGIALEAHLVSDLRHVLGVTFLLGGSALLSVGTIVNNVIVWRYRRSGGAGSKLALSALLAAAAGVIIIIVLMIISVLIPWLELARESGDDETRALRDCESIGGIFFYFHKDTGTWPIYASADRASESRLDFLYGNVGNMPQFKDGEVRESWGTRSQDMYFHFVTNGRQEPIYRYRPKDETGALGWDESPKGWDGPYFPCLMDDPWGFAYLISVGGFEGGTKPDNHVWCLSAGPNGVVDTPAWATATRGDDVGYRTK